ncbi:MAG: shikimate kinase [Syntrophomonadaceae bacterium]|jgi:shikimate kinase|nr:shikimate kinase [Syntrophomonadaceae bacterium]
MKTAGQRKLKNLVFIGMPGSGKTTISKRVAKLLRLPWYDCDSEIETEEQMSVAQIFNIKGEEYFRLKETACIGRLSKLNGIVFAVGGGAVLRNADAIRRNSVVIYVKRELGSIASTIKPGTRPLLEDMKNLRRLYEERHLLYEKTGGYSVANDGTIEDAARKVCEIYYESAGYKRS